MRFRAATNCDRHVLVFMDGVVNVWLLMELTFRYEGKGNNANDFKIHRSDDKHFLERSDRPSAGNPESALYCPCRHGGRFSVIGH